MPSGTSPDLPAPWDEFLAELDRRLPEPVILHCQRSEGLQVVEAVTDDPHQLFWVDADVVVDEQPHAVRRLPVLRTVLAPGRAERAVRGRE